MKELVNQLITVDPTVLFAAGFSQVHSQSSYDIVTQGSSWQAWQE